MSADNEAPIVYPYNHFKNLLLDSQTDYINKNTHEDLTVKKCDDTIDCGITIQIPVVLKKIEKTYQPNGADITEHKCFALKGNVQFLDTFILKKTKVIEVNCAESISHPNEEN